MKYLLMLLLLLSTSTFSQIPRKYSDFTLKGIDGKEYSLSDFKNSKAIVIIFISTQCPVSNDYNSRMEKLYNDYKNRGVTFLGINSNKEESVDEIRAHASKNNLTFLILKDYHNKIADTFKASYTPEVYVLSPDFNLLYHGRIDDARKIKNVKQEDLKNALEEILSGKEVTIKETKAFGCTIKREEND